MRGYDCKKNCEKNYKIGQHLQMLWSIKYRDYRENMKHNMKHGVMPMSYSKTRVSYCYLRSQDTEQFGWKKIKSSRTLQNFKYRYKKHL